MKELTFGSIFGCSVLRSPNKIKCFQLFFEQTPQTMSCLLYYFYCIKSFSTQHWWGHFCSAVSRSELPCTRKALTDWSGSRKGPWTELRDWSIFPGRGGWESKQCSVWWREGSGGLYQCVQVADGVEWRRWSQTLLSNIQWQDKRHKL